MGGGDLGCLLPPAVGVTTNVPLNNVGLSDVLQNSSFTLTLHRSKCWFVSCVCCQISQFNRWAADLNQTKPNSIQKTLKFTAPLCLFICSFGWFCLFVCCEHWVFKGRFYSQTGWKTFGHAAQTPTFVPRWLNCDIFGELKCLLWKRSFSCEKWFCCFGCLFRYETDILSRSSVRRWFDDVDSVWPTAQVCGGVGWYEARRSTPRQTVRTLWDGFHSFILEFVSWEQSELLSECGCWGAERDNAEPCLTSLLLKRVSDDVTDVLTVTNVALPSTSTYRKGSEQPVQDLKLNDLQKLSCWPFF